MERMKTNTLARTRLPVWGIKRISERRNGITLTKINSFTLTKLYERKIITTENRKHGKNRLREYKCDEKEE